MSKQERNFELNPYSPDEARVAAWLADRTGAGGGDDPIGFLLLSHETLARQRNSLRHRLVRIFGDLGYDPKAALDRAYEAQDADSGDPVTALSGASPL